MAEPLTGAERDNLIHHLQTSAERFTRAVELMSKTPAWNVAPPEGGWSPAQAAEHILLTQQRIAQLVVTDLPRKDPVVRTEQREALDAVILRRVPDRSSGRKRMEAPEHLRPENRWPDPAELLKVFAEQHRSVVDFVRTTDCPLRAHTAPHMALGELDGCQWLLTLAAHTQRHVSQMEEAYAANKASGEPGAVDGTRSGAG